MTSPHIRLKFTVRYLNGKFHRKKIMVRNEVMLNYQLEIQVDFSLSRPGP